MKHLLFLIILSFAHASFAQEEPAAKLIDEFGEMTCESLLAHSDYLANMLKESLENRAVVVVYSEPGLDQRANRQMQMMHRSLIAASGNRSRVTFMRGPPEKTGPRTEIWLVPAGAAFKSAAAEVYAEIPFPIKKKTWFASDDPGPCSGQIYGGFIEMLKSDANLTGYVVVVNDPKSERRETAEYYMKGFRESGVSNRKLRIYFRSQRMQRNDYYGYTEYWLYPKKSN